jgi:alkylation response protein AidB-like acyl-CoA dehydrogenase
MDLAFTDEQNSLRELAKQIFIDRCGDERLREIEASGSYFDAELWDELARAHLLGFAIPEEFGGNGGGILELCILLEQAGRFAAPVPLWATQVCGTLPVAMFGSAEQKERLLTRGAVVTAASRQLGARDPLRPSVRAQADGGWILSGTAVEVPAVDIATRILVAASTEGGVGLFLVDPGVATITPQPNTSAEPLWMVTLDDARVEPADVLLEADATERWGTIMDHALVGLCALQAGVAEQALRITAEYTSGREQFGRPLGSFQAVQQRVADAYVDIEAMRWTMWHAAWRLSEGLPATDQCLEAKYFAAEAGHRVLAASQHLHGGIGVDMTYPLHRYTFLSKQIELTLGGATEQLDRLGARMASA